MGATKEDVQSFTEDNSTKNKVISLEEIKKHHRVDDLWLILHGRVYDVTKFQDEHPGGPDILHSYGGEDGTEEFEDTFHSSSARDMLAAHYIGDAEGMEQTDYNNPPNSSTSTGTSNFDYSMLLPLIVILIGFFYKFFLN